MAFSISAWRRWSASSSRGVAVSIGDEGVVTVIGEQRQLGAGSGLHPAHDEPYRSGVGLTLKWRVFGFGHVGSAVHPVGDGVQSASEWPR